MQTVTVELPDQLAAMLEGICLESNKIKQEVIKELIIQYLEDIEDVAEATAVLARDEPTISAEQLRIELGLHN